MIVYNRLWKMLKEKNIKPSQLYILCHVHPNTINKMKNGENIETNSIDKICEFLKCQPGDIMNYIN